MNNDFDRIRAIRAKLAALLCLSCRQQGLGLVLRYDPHKEGALFVAYCKFCWTKYAVDPDTAIFG